MPNWAQIDAVQRMQDHLAAHADDPEYDFTAMCAALGYSGRHASRLFSSLVGRTPVDYLRHLRLTIAARKLAESGENIVDVAVAAGYDSHDGFTRAFTRRFGLTPSDYRNKRPPVAWFVASPVRHYFSYLEPDREVTLSTITCTVTIAEHPERMLLLQRSLNADEYWSYCAEKGCEWEGLLASIPENLCPPALLTLPDELVTPGTSRIAAGVDLPLGWEGRVPQGYELVRLRSGHGRRAVERELGTQTRTYEEILRELDSLRIRRVRLARSQQAVVGRALAAGLDRASIAAALGVSRWALRREVRRV